MDSASAEVSPRSVPITNHQDFDVFVTILPQMYPCETDRIQWVGVSIMRWDLVYVLERPDGGEIDGASKAHSLALLMDDCAKAAGEVTEVVTAGSGEEMSPEPVADFFEKPTRQS
jgi:hypothetical protein